MAARADLDTLEIEKNLTLSNKNLCCPPAQPSDHTVYIAPAPQDNDTNFWVFFSSTIIFNLYYKCTILISVSSPDINLNVHAKPKNPKLSGDTICT